MLPLSSSGRWAPRRVGRLSVPQARGLTRWPRGKHVKPTPRDFRNTLTALFHFCCSFILLAPALLFGKSFINHPLGCRRISCLPGCLLKLSLSLGLSCFKAKRVCVLARPAPGVLPGDDVMLNKSKQRLNWPRTVSRLPLSPLSGKHRENPTKVTCRL